MNENEIVYLETRMDRFRGRWRAMSRTARMGIVSVVFGVIGLLTSFFVSYVPFLSLPFSAIGFVIGVTSFLVGFYHNLRRDGFWFPLTGSVLSMLGLAIALGGWSNEMESREQQQEQAEQDAAERQRERFTGRWLRGEGANQESLEMTVAGSLLWKGTDNQSGDETTVARFQFSESSLVMSFGDSESGRERTIVRYSVDTSNKDKLLLSDRRVVSGDPHIDMSGVWKRVGPPRILTAAEKEIADYRSKLEQFQAQGKRIGELVTKFEDQRDELLVKLRPYDHGKPQDDRWKVWARELNTVVEQIHLLQQRKPRLDQAVVRLEAAIGHLTRQAELELAELDTEQLEDLLMTTDKLDEQLKLMESNQSVEEAILRQTVRDEMEKNPGQGQQ